MESKRHDRLRALRLTLPVMCGYLFLGAAFGAVLAQAGFGPAWALAASTLVYAGSLQFVMVPLMCAGTSLVTVALTALLVNARHLFYGVSMLEKYRGLGGAKPALIYLLSDETFSIVSSVTPPQEVSAKDFYLAVSILDYVYWVGGSLLGSLAGQFIRFDTTGLDFALTGLFVVLFIEQVTDPQKRAGGIIGLACSVVALTIFGADRLVIPAMLLVLAALLIGRKKL